MISIENETKKAGFVLVYNSIVADRKRHGLAIAENGIDPDILKQAIERVKT